MRNFKFLMVLVILLAGCICIGSAFATNVTDISDVSVSDVTITDEVEIVYDDSIQNNAEFTSLQSNEGNFIDLKQKIYNAIDGDTILLDKNYKYLESDDMLEGVIINKTLTIDGQGNTIDGSNLARVFNVSANNVIIKNINFIDCSAIKEGGVIYWFGVDGSVSGCNFTDCSAEFGGAIEWYEIANGSVSGCNFTDCSAIWGGAIDWDDSPDGSVSGCSFVDCSASFGGAIYINQESLSISNCTSTPSVKAPIYNEGTILSDVMITTLNGDVKSVNYGETINLTGTVTACGLSVAGQELSFKVNGKEINAKSDDYGIYSTSYTVDFVGDKNVDATYEGSTGPETVNNGKLISSKVDVIVTVDNVKGKVGDKVKFTAKVHDIYGNPVQGGVVIFGFNGKEYKANVMNGVATIEVVLSKAGTYSATAYYEGDENHNDDYVIFAVDVINGSNPNPNPINKSGIPMEHTGNLLIVLLIALITLPILKRK